MLVITNSRRSIPSFHYSSVRGSIDTLPLLLHTATRNQKQYWLYLLSLTLGPG